MNRSALEHDMVADPNDVAETPTQWRQALALWLGLLVVVLVDFTHLLHVEWLSNDQYSYGLFLPPLLLWLAWRRWLTAPAPRHRAHFRRELAFGLCFCFVFGLLPFNWLSAANPDWRLLFWAYGFGAVAFLQAQMLAVGGWPWFRHFLPVWLLLLLALPWPTFIESSLIGGFMKVIASGVTELLNVFGIIAKQSGHLIQLPSGKVGVEEACSGIRSFQLSLVCALVFAEVDRLSNTRRTLLLGVCLLGALILNFVRTLSLTLIFHYQGHDVMTRWHDNYGIIAMVAVVGLAWAGSTLLKRSEPDITPFDSRKAFIANLPPIQLTTAWLVLALVMGALPYGYFLWRESGTEPLPRVALKASLLPEGAETFAIPDASRAQLRYSDGLAVRYQPTSRTLLFAYQFYWEAGRISSFAGVHNPAICLPSSGYVLEREFSNETRSVVVNGQGLDFRSYLFRADGHPVYVFFSIRDNREGEPVPPAVTAGDRIRQALKGHRIRDRQVTEVIVIGKSNLNAAWDTAKAFLYNSLSPQD